MANILLGVTGSVAALKTPELVAALQATGHAVKVVATDAALYFFDPVALDPSQTERNRELVIIDADEWPGKDAGQRYQRGDIVQHIELRRWADLLLIAPLDANTLGKLACGLCDNALTCVGRAWDLSRPLVVAPAMNTAMWEHPMTLRHLRVLAADFGAAHVPGHLAHEAMLAQINERSRLFRIVPPVTKLLACGDVGVGAMAEVAEIVQHVLAMLVPKVVSA
jgi:phosphopantothenoylcysteine decarboxylase